MASHSNNKWEFGGQIYTVKPGQFITSYSNLSKKCAPNVSIKNVRTALNKLEKWGFLARKSTNKNTLITICNWETYQNDNSESGKQNGKRTANGRQTDGKRTATIKNEEECIKKKIRMKNKTVDPKILSESLRSDCKEDLTSVIKNWDKILMSIQNGDLTGVTEESLTVFLQKSKLEPESMHYQKFQYAIPRVIASANRLTDHEKN